MIIPSIPFHFKTELAIIAIVFLAIIITLFWLLTLYRSRVQKRPIMSPCPDRWKRDKNGYCLSSPSNSGDKIIKKTKFDGILSTRGARRQWASLHGIYWDGL